MRFCAEAEMTPRGTLKCAGKHFVPRSGVKDPPRRMDCPVCCERAACFACPSCSSEVCAACVLRYVKESSRLPHCMNSACKAPWTLTNQQRMFPRRVVQELRKHTKSVLVDRELGLLPFNVKYVETKRQLREALRDRTELMRKCREHRRRTDDILGDARHRNRLHGDSFYFSAESRTELHGRQDELRALAERLAKVKIRVRQLRQLLETKFDRKTGFLREDKKNGDGHSLFLRACPSANCAGFVTSRTTLSCDVCGNEICDRCHEARNSEHRCDETVASDVEKIKAESKNCPSCAVPIFRAEGCPQMWCTRCRCAFHWITGKKLETRHFHNLHHQDFLNETRNNQSSPQQVVARIREKFGNLNLVSRICGAMLRTFAEVAKMGVHSANKNDAASHLDLRVRFLTREESRDKLAASLYRRHVSAERQRGKRQLLADFSEELFRAIKPILDAEQHSLNIVAGAVTDAEKARMRFQVNFGVWRDTYSSKAQIPFNANWKWNNVG